MLAACGGGGGGSGEMAGNDGSDGSSATPSLTLSGTAATGLALAGADVTVKCAAGNGATQTGGDGRYSISMENAELPCMIEVVGTTPDGDTTTLHSIADTGNIHGAETSATANVTPLTEMVITQMTGDRAASVFDSFGAGSTVNSNDLQSATSAVLSALNIDLGATDPFKANLTAATSTTPSTDSYDQALDTLAANKSVNRMVNDMVEAIAAGSSSTAALTQAVSNATNQLAGCPSATSGNYRSISYTGRMRYYVIDFAANTVRIDTSPTPSTDFRTIRPTPNGGACEFQIMNAAGTAPDAIVFVGTQGAGAVRLFDTSGSNAALNEIGYFFPSQRLTLASMQGEWRSFETGHDENNQFGFRFSKATISGTSINSCNYDTEHGPENFATCTADPQGATGLSGPQANGSFDVVYGDEVLSKLYGFRAQDGTLSLFGYNFIAPGQTIGERTAIVAVRPFKRPLPAVGNIARYWNMNLSHTATNGPGNPAITIGGAANITQTVDAATSTITRSGLPTPGSLETDGIVSTFKLNDPVDGMAYRVPDPAQGISAMYQLVMPALGMTVSFSANPNVYFLSISPNRPPRS
jgi:hypothetical protein